ncbi:MAG TPA: cytochrome c-type biogenesis protein CcmH [Candidatus Solibacter sp.]|jgi:cytochrome c-type biogenesis protein CcmH|nr:cytochrome c-type biogenesis protein CcmH [Candidatus Solibacter sp.]
MTRFRQLALALALLCSVGRMMGADDEKARFEKVGDKMQCMCGCNQMLLKCNHVGCPVSPVMIRDLQASIKVKSDDEEVLDWFRKNYGVTAVILPSSHGFELTAWVVPPVVLTLAIGLLILIISTWRRRMPRVAAGANAALDPELESLRSRARRETEI